MRRFASPRRDGSTGPDHYSKGGGGSHSDNIQVLTGDNITIRGNTIRGSENFAVLGAPEWGDMKNMLVENSYVDGGICTMKFSHKGDHAHSVIATNNRFGPHHTSSDCELVIVSNTNVTQSGNVRASDGSPVNIQYPSS